jgi:hypothetical protein
LPGAAFCAAKAFDVFLVCQILGILTWPSNLMLMLGFLGAVVLATRFARARLQCLLASILLLAIFDLSPLADALILPLEQRFPPWKSARGTPDGIIVLGGAFDPRIAAWRGEVSLKESAERMTSAERGGGQGSH